MITIEKTDKNRYVKFEELPIGRVFRYNNSDRVFMKIQNIYDYNESVEYNAIQLNTGEAAFIDSDDALIEVDIKLSIKDIKFKEE